jgi:hypothetical protein
MERNFFSKASVTYIKIKTNTSAFKVTKCWRGLGMVHFKVGRIYTEPEI